MSKNFELLQALEQSVRVPFPARNEAETAAQMPPGTAHKPPSEEITRLVQRLFLAPSVGNRNHMVVFSGVETDVDYSELCAQIARTLAARTSARICMVDANLCRPALHLCFRLANGLGLSDALLQREPIRELCLQTNVKDLWLLPCGRRAAEVRAEHSPDRLIAIIDELRQEFDYVLVLGPQADCEVHGLVLSEAADGLVLMLEANRTRREVAKSAKEVLEATSVRLLGAVLNHRTYPIPEALYRKL